jgi:hypothetical protein
MGALTMLWVASGVPMRWLTLAIPILSGFRHIAHVAVLAVPAILAIAGYGLDRLLELPWPQVRLGLSSASQLRGVSISLAWVLVIPTLSSLHATDAFDQTFLGSFDRSNVYQAMSALSTPSLQWVAVPLGEHYWIDPGLAAGLKLTGVAFHTSWRDRPVPAPLLEATRLTPDSDVSPWGYLWDLPIFLDPSSEYASVQAGSERFPCTAHGKGGDLRVTCRSPGGTLVLRENRWTGWTATVNNQPVQLEDGPWLSVQVPEGTVEARFRYLPADAAVGVAMTLAGLVLLGVLWARTWRRPKEAS